MHPRVLPIAGAALAVGIVVLLASIANDHDRPSDAKPAGKGEPTKRSSTPTRRTPTRRPLIRIAGEVLDEGGLPVKGATVYVLSKKRAGANRDKIRHEVSDARGQWDLRVRKTVDCWIGVVAPGYRTTWLDGDGVDIGVKIIHVVKRSPALAVTIVDEAGKPLAKQGVQLAPWPPGGNWFCPGPKCRQGEQWGVTNEAGKATFRQDVAAPVLVTPFIEGYHGHPAPAWLPEATGDLKLVVHPNASLEVKVTSATPLTAEDNLITLEFFERARGRGVFAFTETLPLSGVLTLEQVLRPGTWHLRVSVPGRPAVLLEDIEIPESRGLDFVPAVKVALAARREQTTAQLTLRVTGNVGTRQPRGDRRAPLVYFMRTDGRWSSLGWQVGGPESFDSARGYLRFALAPGRYRVLVADVLTGRAALDRDVVVAPAASTETSMPMKLGQFGALPAVRDGAVYVRSLEAKAGDGMPLPLFGSSRDGTQRFSRAIDLIARKLMGEDVVMGPYPSDEFSVLMIRSDDTHKRAAYR
jgi:hypothetical protein